MGLADLFTRSTTYVATDDKTGASQTFVITDNLAPGWSHGDYDGAMSLPGAWRASTFIADLVGQLPWQAYRSRPGEQAEQITPTPQLLEEPCPGDTRMTTNSSMALDLVWHGNAFGIVAARDADGFPTAHLPVPAEYVRARRATQADGYIGVPEGTVLYEVGRDVYAAHDVVHVKGPCRPGALRGMGVLEAHLNKTLALADEQERQARQLGSLGIPSGILKSTDPDFDEDDARALKAQWIASQRDRTVQVVGPEQEFTALAWNPTETQLLEARRFSLHQIALIFGLSPSWLGVAGASMTYSNLETEWANFVRSTLAAHVVRFEQTFSTHMRPGEWAKANLDGLLRGTTKERYDAYSSAITAGWLLRDEVRALEDRPPLPVEAEPTEEPDGEARSQHDLHKYWTRGEGKAKWIGESEPLVALYRHLLRHMGNAKTARWTALSWFEDTKGRPPIPADGVIEQ